MLKSPKEPALANPKRFRTIQDLTRLRPDCGSSIDDIIIIDNELLQIVDLFYIGDTLNTYNSLSASYVRTHGVIVVSHGRDTACSVLWKPPFLMLPLSHHLKENIAAYSDIGKVVGNISCASGSFLFLPVREDFPTSLGDMMDEALIKEAGTRIKVPNGTYRIFYEQFEVSEGAQQELYRNVVVQKQ